MSAERFTIWRCGECGKQAPHSPHNPASVDRFCLEHEDEPGRTARPKFVEVEVVPASRVTGLEAERDEAYADSRRSMDRVNRLLHLATKQDALVAERDELRAEVERLHKAAGLTVVGGAVAIDALVAERDRLRAALNEMLVEYADHQSWRCGHPDMYPHDHPDGCPCGLTKAQERARAALDGTEQP